MASLLVMRNEEHAGTIAEQADLIVLLEEKLTEAQASILDGLEHKRLLGIEKASNSEMNYKVRLDMFPLAFLL